MSDEDGWVVIHETKTRMSVDGALECANDILKGCLPYDGETDYSAHLRDYGYECVEVLRDEVLRLRAAVKEWEDAADDARIEALTADEYTP